MTTLENPPVGFAALTSRGGFRPVQNLFFSRAEAQPRAPAIICDDHFRNYGEIAGRASALSVRLTEAGAARHGAVAVIMESGWERIVAVLGALASGAGYVCIDPSWPPPLRQRLLREEKASVIVTQPWLEPELASDGRRPVLNVDDALKNRGYPAPQRHWQSPGDLACVWQGPRPETRRRVDHRAASQQVSDVNDRNDVDSSDSLFELGALDGTVSPYDPLGPLAVGGSVVIPTKDEVTHPAQWIDLIQDYEPTIWSSRPALLQTLIEEASPARESALVSLRLVLVAAEGVPADLARAARHLLPQARVIAVPAFLGSRAPRVARPSRELAPPSSP